MRKSHLTIIVCIVYNLVVTMYGRVSYKGWGASQLTELSSNCYIGVVRCIVCV